MEQSISPGLRFSLLHRSFKKKMDETLSEKELTGVQFGVLATLVRLERETEDEISQRALEERTHLSHPTMTEIIKRLEKKGFLRCETSSRDRRFKSISATEKAYRLGQEVKAVEEETFSWLCRGLAEEQAAQLIAITDVMLQNAIQSLESCTKGSADCCD